MLEETEEFPGSDALLPEEAAAMRKANPRRLREFAAGRWCARRALLRLGLPSLPIPVGTDRAPVWPEGVVGSITHTDSYCAAVVAHRDELLSLGIDAEQTRPLDEETMVSVCTRAELDWLLQHDVHGRGLLALVMFSAKEAFFKFQFPLTGRRLDLADIEVRLDEGLQSFEVGLVAGDRTPGLRDLTGRIAVGPRLILTAAYAPANAGSVESLRSGLRSVS